jgi:hypothetical protein
VSPRFRRKSGLTERETDGVVFLADAANGSLYRLNETGSALWRLLADPISASEAAARFREAFPDVPPAKVNRRVARLLQALREEELVERVGTRRRTVAKRGGSR